MFIHVKSTPNSPRRSVQIVESVRDGDKVKQRIVRYVGIALDEAEEAKLRDLATEFMQRMQAERLSESALFETPRLLIYRAHAKPRGRPKKRPLSEVAGVDQVQLADLVEESRVIEGPHEVLGSLYEYLRFDQILPKKRQSAMLRDLVLARIMHSHIKAGTQKRLAQQWGRTIWMQFIA